LGLALLNSWFDAQGYALMKSAVRRWALVLLGWSFSAAAAAAASKQTGPRLFLAGGHLPLCSSASLAQCEAGRWHGAPARNAPRYRLDAAALRRIEALNHTTLRAALPALRSWQQKQSATALDFASASALLDALPQSLRLTVRDEDQLLDLCEVAQRGADGARLREQVDLQRSRNAAAAALYRDFVRLAKSVRGVRGKPRVLLLTASSRDSFAAVDYYLAGFRAAGAQVRWLPLDVALRQVLDAGLPCRELEAQRQQRTGTLDRQRVYPDLVQIQQDYCQHPVRILRDVQWADAVFLNGGDQSLTRASLFRADGSTSPALALMLRRLERGELLLGGTSAGSAVQAAQAPAGVMISNGSNSSALRVGAHAGAAPDCADPVRCAGDNDDQLSYARAGGLGSFAFGVVDTHFSERGRQWRLAVLLDQLQLPLGVGVDETTALSVQHAGSQVHLQVYGRGAVHWLLPVPQSPADALQADAALDLVVWRQTSGTVIEAPAAQLIEQLRGTPRACAAAPDTAVALTVDPEGPQLDDLLRKSDTDVRTLRLSVQGRAGLMCALDAQRWRLQLAP
jgi:cyanophycinase